MSIERRNEKYNKCTDSIKTCSPKLPGKKEEREKMKRALC
jgi:hypothetical protein